MSLLHDAYSKQQLLIVKRYNYLKLNQKLEMMSFF
ncbi:hypothetical protein M2263_001374 [Providencia alcalifaciens]|nr:hypothetical protein [Providencia alcalifaciens]